MTTAFVLAGGLGTRLRSVISNAPKPMAPVDDQPFLEYLLKFWITQGISKFIISVSYMRDSIINYFGDNYQGIQIEYFIEKDPLGTGGGLIKIANQLSNTFVVINGDTFFEISLNELKLFKNKTQAEVVIALFKSNDRDRYGQVLLNEINQVKGFLKSNKDYSELSNGGVYLIDPIVLNKNSYKFNIKCSLENDILPTLINQGSNVVGIEQKGKFLDIGVPADYNRAKKFLKLEKKN
jgi:D-glycero-alpha-D-manno-heptose 1-phosphate guanylyltransferase